MPDLPKKKIGIIACSGEEIPEGTITRLAALKVLEDLRPQDTVTLCLPLFLAGGESERTFSRFYPTIAIDGCEKRCAYRSTEKYSNRPAAGFIVTELVQELNLDQPDGLRRLNPAGQQVVSVLSARVAGQVDLLMEKHWNRKSGAFAAENPSQVPQAATQATCACGSGVPVMRIIVDGQEREVVALPLIFENYKEEGKPAVESTANELLEMVKVYNPILPEAENAYQQVLLREYASFLARGA